MEDVTTIEVGAFDVGPQIGAGGMGAVFRATHRVTGLPVAMKVIVESGREDAVRAFRREVQAHAALSHPGIAYLFEYGELERDAALESDREIVAGSPFVVMELAERGTLREFRVTNWNQVRGIVVQVLDALAFAHARGVIHRDLKPENLLVFGGDSEIRVKLTDFGIAHAVGAIEDHNLQSLDGASGTPHYMPPEQLRGRWREYGPWTDLYALGCMVYELVSGEPPFDAELPFQVAMKHVTKERPPLRPRFPVPDRLRDWVRRAMAIDPRHRFRRANEALWALPERFAAAGDGPGRTPHDVEDTTVVASDTYALGATVGLVADTTLILDGSLSGDDVSSTVGPAEIQSIERPPIPSNWERPRDVGADRMLVGTGLGLFGLREPPLVGRRTERDVLWDAYCQTADESHLNIVLIEGEAGVGKSRLAEWLTWRAHEVGSARALRATHSEDGAGGLTSMVREAFGTWMLGRSEVYDRLLDVLPPLDDDDSLRDADARALTELLHPTARDAVDVDGPRYVFSTAGQKLGVYDRLMRRVARRRPTVVWLDDLQWGSEAIELLEHLVESADGAPPVLVIATLRSDVLAEQPRLAARIGDLETAAAARRLTLEPLGSDENRQLVSRLLPLEADDAEFLAERMEGNPLFGFQLLANWVERGDVVAAAGGLRLEVEGAGDVPDDIHVLWLRRVARLLEVFDDPASVGASLEIAAALGREVRRKEWILTCREAGLDVSDRLWREATERGVARATDEGWRFAHGLLVESIARMARDGGRWAEHHARCARMLESRRDSDTALRRAQHWIAAGEGERALEPLLQEAMRRGYVGDDDAKRTVLVLRRRVLDELEVGADELASLENEIEIMFCDSLTRTSSGSLHQQAADLHRRAEGLGNNRLLARTAMLLAQLSARLGALTDAREWSERSLVAARASGDVEAEQAAAWRCGWVLVKNGHPDEAEPFFFEAQSLAGSMGRVLGEARAAYGLATVAMARGESKRAKRLLGDTIEVVRAVGVRTMEAYCLNALGELARFEGDADAAREHYEEFALLARELGIPRQEALAVVNLAFTEFLARDFERAERLLEQVERGAKTFGASRAAYIHLGRAILAASSGDWAAFEQRLEQIQPWPESGRLEWDHPWLLELAGNVADEAGQPDRAAEAWRVGRVLYERLGNEEAVARLGQKCERL